MVVVHRKGESRRNVSILLLFHLQGIDVEVLRAFPAQNNLHLVLGKIRREGDGNLPEILGFKC